MSASVVSHSYFGIIATCIIAQGCSNLGYYARPFQGGKRWQSVFRRTNERVLVLLIGFEVLGSQLEDRIVGIQMILFGAILLMIFGIPALFNLRVNRMEFALREHLLELQLKVAELTDSK